MVSSVPGTSGTCRVAGNRNLSGAIDPQSSESAIDAVDERGHDTRHLQPCCSHAHLETSADKADTDIGAQGTAQVGEAIRDHPLLAYPATDLSFAQIQFELEGHGQTTDRPLQQPAGKSVDAGPGDAHTESAAGNGNGKRPALHVAVGGKSYREHSGADLGIGDTGIDPQIGEDRTHVVPEVEADRTHGLAQAGEQLLAHHR